jgi:Na+-transporting NADH:ubiquinone oxidoreductase subunit B
MKFLRSMNEKVAPLFEKGGKLERFFPLFEAHDTFLFTPDSVTKTTSHVRDAIDLKRMMIVVVIALLPCMFMAMYNTGYQASTAVVGYTDADGNLVAAEPLACWQTTVFELLGFGFDPRNFLACVIYGALFYIPIYVVTMIAGGLCETLFSMVRKHEINEGFLVTGALFPLILPATTPLWQVALGKEIFGGTGMNWLNPALTARAFLFFAYPAQISGDAVWIAAKTSPDGYSGATLLSEGAAGGADLVTAGATWWEAFVGLVPGSMGETSTLFCIFGAIVLIITQVGSWRTMLGGFVGCTAMALVLNAIDSDTNLFFNVPFYWHWVLGGFAFGIVFMATDPVSSAFTDLGKLLYGFFIGVLGILIRVINPAYPEGWMLAILFMNMFAPLIDHYVVQANIKRRLARNAA